MLSLIYIYNIYNIDFILFQLTDDYYQIKKLLKEQIVDRKKVEFIKECENDIKRNVGDLFKLKN